MKMENPIFSLLLISLLSIFFTKTIADDIVTLNVLSFGAKPDGKTDSTKALLNAWAVACGSLKPATIFVPQGKYLVKQAHFKGKCKNRAIMLKIDGILIAPSDYNVIGNSKNWLLFQGVDGVSIHGGILDGQGNGLWACKTSGKNCPTGATGKVVCNNRAIMLKIDGILIAPSDYNVIGNSKNWLLFQGVDGVSIHGGILDGQGNGLWACKTSGKNCPTGATTLGFSNSNNIAITGLTSLNSQMFHIVFNGCKNVKLQAVDVFASGKSPNTDGIHVQFSSHMSILNSKISTGDDCISIGPGTTNLWIQNMACGPGHGISIGSLGKDFQEAGVQNVTVKSVIFKNTQNGVRIKTWGRPSTGFVKNVLFKHATMINVQNPIVIDQNYCPYNKNCPGQVSGVTISDITYQDIHGSSATRVAMKFDCSKRNPCRGIKLEDVDLTYKNQPAAQASCANVAGTTSGIIQPTSCL